MQVDGLTKSFGDLVLFRKISFGVAEGQRIGLIAKNGTGKTTLLNIIGTAHPDYRRARRRKIHAGFSIRDLCYF